MNLIDKALQEFKSKRLQDRFEGWSKEEMEIFEDNSLRIILNSITKEVEGHSADDIKKLLFCLTLSNWIRGFYKGKEIGE